MTVVSNPLLPGCHPDPTICRVGEDYYLVTSTFEYLPGLPVFRSRDLVDWEVVGHVIDRPGMLDLEGIRSSGGLYAPTLRHHDGRFWLLCTLVDQEDDARGGNFVVTAEDPSGPWSDPVWLDVDGIDPSVFFDDDGRIWVHGTRPARQPEWHDQTEVWLRELDPHTMTLVTEEHVLWRGAVQGAVWAEGPHLYRVAGAYHLLAAEGGTDFHHAISVARADAVTGPYRGSKGNPVLTHRHLGRGVDITAVGHADLVEAPDGSWWAVLLGMRPYGGYHCNLGRETFLVPVVWEDGWPVFAPGIGRVEHEVEVPFAQPRAAAPVGGVIASNDPRWTSLRALPSEIAAADGDGWVLPLLPATLADATRSAFLGVRQQHRDVDVTATIACDLREGEEAGLVVRQSEDDHVRLSAVGVTAEGTRVVAIHRSAGVERVIGEAVVVGAPHEDLVLMLRARGQDYELRAGRPGDDLAAVATADGRTLDSIATGGFLGLWIGVHGTSNGAATDSTMRVERVEYVPR